MKKLALELEALRVESFTTSLETHVPRGTVRGHAFFGTKAGCQPTQTLPPSDATCASGCGCPTDDCTIAC